jgi:hypothetical protein
MNSEEVDLTADDGADTAPAAGIPPMAQRRTLTPHPESQLAPTKFPGKKGVLRAKMTPFMIVIFHLMQQIRPHVEIGSRNRKGTAKWKELFDLFFNRTNGMGQNFTLWVGDDGWKKSKKQSWLLSMAMPWPMRITLRLRRRYRY